MCRSRHAAAQFREKLIYISMVFLKSAAETLSVVTTRNEGRDSNPPPDLQTQRAGRYF
jgi:hypothetical protein